MSFVSGENGLKKVQFLLWLKNLHIKVDFFRDSTSLLNSLFTIMYIKKLGFFIREFDLHFLDILESLDELVTELKHLEEVLLAASKDCVATMNHFFVR